MTSCSSVSEDRARTTAQGLPLAPWVALGGFGVIVVLFFAPGLFAAKVPVFRDLLVLVIPLRRYALDAIGSGELPLWNPHLFFGSPFLANYQSAVLYPPSVILYALPFPESLSVFLAFHLLIAGVGMTLYLWSAHDLESSAASFGGVVFAFGGFFVSLIPLTNQLEVAAWVPWVLLAAQKLVARGDLRWFAALTLLFAMQALGGAPEGVALTVVLVTATSLPHWRRMTWLGAAFFLALALSAAQLIPTLEYALETNRVAGLPYSSVVSESLLPRSFLQLVLPHTFMDGAPSFVPEGGVPLFWSLYWGILPLCLGIVGLLGAPFSRWSLLLAGGIALALGGSTPIFPLLYRLAPQAVGMFRYPGKFFLLAHVAAAVLAARGLARTAEQATPRAAMVTLTAIAALSGFLAAWGSLAPQAFLTTLGYAAAGLGTSTYELLAGPPRWSALRAAALAITALMILWMFAQRRVDTRGLAVALIAVTLADLLPVHQPTLVFADWKTLQSSVEPRRLGLEDGDRIFHYCVRPGCVPAGAPGFGAWNGTLQPLDRVETRAQQLWAALVPDVPIVYGIGAVAGVDGWATRDREEFYRLLALLPHGHGVHLLAALAVNQLIGQSPFDDAALELISREGDDGGSRYWRYRTAAPAPRLYLADRILVAADARSALERIAQPDFRPGRDAVVSAPPPAPVGRETGKIEETTFGRGFVRARVSLPVPGFLVVADSWYPGWSASVDGSAVDIIRTNGIVRGVYVAAGRHDVEMHYSPASFRVGCRISLAAATVLVTIVLLSLRHRSMRD